MSTQQVILAALLIILSCATTACYSAHVFSPSGRVALLEAAKPLGKDEQKIGVHNGRSFIENTQLDHLTVLYRHGLSDQLEVGVDANLEHYPYMPGPSSRTSPYVGSGRIGAKWAPKDLVGYVAFFGGIGAGAYAGGPFISPDIGVILAVENANVVPFLTVSAYLSIPLDAQDIDLSYRGRENNIQPAKTTLGTTATMGIRVPIDMDGWTLAPSLGVAYSNLDDQNRQSPAFVAASGLDVEF